MRILRWIMEDEWVEGVEDAAIEVPEKMLEVHADEPWKSLEALMQTHMHPIVNMIMINTSGNHFCDFISFLAPQAQMVLDSSGVFLH